jgi:very-short-patch-repair endonuclease
MESVLELRADGAVTESWLEREFLRVLERAGLPLPACQARIDNRGSFAARVDFLYEDIALVIEVSGYRHHSTREQMSADARRRADLLDAGYSVLEFSHDQIVNEPAYVAERVRSALSVTRAA